MTLILQPREIATDDELADYSAWYHDYLVTMAGYHETR